MRKLTINCIYNYQIIRGAMTTIWVIVYRNHGKVYYQKYIERKN